MMEDARQQGAGTAPHRDGAQSIGRAFDVLLCVSSCGARGAGFDQVLRDAGLKRSTLHRLLGALVRTRLLEHDSQGDRYRLGESAHAIGKAAEHRFGLHRRAVGGVAVLAELSGDTAFLTLRRGNHSVCLHREEGAFPIRALGLAVGDRHPLGVGAGSIAMLAAMPDAHVEGILAANEPAFRTRYACLSRRGLVGLIAEARERGFATNRGLIHPGSWAIGVVVRDEAGAANAALSIGATEARLDERRQHELASLLQREANAIESSLRNLCA
jgi:DNA-binding IclR family transcriptional regulator